MSARDAVEELSVTTADGRTLGVALWGDPGGARLFWLHGTPGSRLIRHPGDTYRSLGLLVCTYDRPGYGLSSRSPGRSVADVADDVELIADALGWSHFAVAGVSGGGGPALATAALLPDRVTRCATVVTPAPFTAARLDFFAGMDQEARADWQNTAAGDEAALLKDWEATLAWASGGMPGIDAPDDVTAMLAEAVTEAGRQGPVGFLDDKLAMARDWGFSVESVRTPTRVMAAREDTSVPGAHGEWLVERIPGAELTWVDGGHVGPRDEAEKELLTWLRHDTLD